MPDADSALREYHNRQGQFVVLASGLRIGYRDDWLGKPWEAPEPVLMLHGNIESGVVWHGWVPRLGAKYRLIRPDLPGFGSSTIPDAFDWSLPALADILAEFLDRLGVQSAHIVAAKTGGAMAVQFAANHASRTRTLVLATVPLSPAAAKPDLPADPLDQSARLGSAATKDEVDFYNSMGAATKPQHSSAMHDMLVQARETGYLDRLLPRIAAPTLVITSDRNVMVPVAQAAANQQAISNARLLVITSDAYHIILANTDEVAASVERFLYSHSGGRSPRAVAKQA